MTPRLVLRCGCTVAFEDGAALICPTHGVQSVCRTVGMRKPSFRGVASGPLVQTMDLSPWTGRLTGSEAK